MPKSFADDGAFGAGGGAISGAGPAAGSPIGGVTMNDPGPQGSDPSFGADGPLQAGGGSPFGTSPSFQTGGAPGSSFGGGPPAAISPGSKGGYGGFGDTSVGGGFTSLGAGSVSPFAGGFGFSRGGAIDDDINGSPEQDRISKALSSVDAVLAFGRKLHGLGGGDDESGGAINTQVAGRMPAVPGNQSESGRPPIQPAPGPLPPTDNPFGKRADAGDKDSDDQPGAIDTDEDAA